MKLFFHNATRKTFAKKIWSLTCFCFVIDVYFQFITFKCIPVFTFLCLRVCKCSCLYLYRSHVEHFTRFSHLLWIMEDSYLCKTSTVNMLKLLSSVTQNVKKTKLMFVSLQYSITRSKHIHTSLRKKTLEFPSWSFCTSLFLNTISPLFLKCQLRKSYSHHLDVSLFFLPSFPFYYYG